MPIHMTEKLNKIKKSARILSQKLGRMPKILELATHAGMSQSQVLQLLEYKQNKAISLDTLIEPIWDLTKGLQVA